jgi:hypothetical protein
LGVRGLVEKIRASRRARLQRKVERAAANRGAHDTRPPVVPQDSSLTPPINENWR